MVIHQHGEFGCCWAFFSSKICCREQLFFLFFHQIKYAGADTDAAFPAPSFCHQISTDEFEYQRATGSQEPLAALLEEIATNKEISVKDKKKKLKQVSKNFSGIYLIFKSFMNFYIYGPL